MLIDILSFLNFIVKDILFCYNENTYCYCLSFVKYGKTIRKTFCSYIINMIMSKTIKPKIIIVDKNDKIIGYDDIKTRLNKAFSNA